MEGKYSLRSPAVKRLMREAKELHEPTDQYYAQPLEDNLFEWHFTVRGPSKSDFDGGFYHGRIILPPDYPMKPPSIILLTPNGRFEVGKKICLSVSGHHPETWQPSWSIRTVMLALIGFMPTHGRGAIGSLDYTPEERKKLASRSQEWRCSECRIVLRSVLKRPNPEETSKEKEEVDRLASQISFQAEDDKKNSTPQAEGATAAAGPTPEGATAAGPTPEGAAATAANQTTRPRQQPPFPWQPGQMPEGNAAAVAAMQASYQQSMMALTQQMMMMGGNPAMFQGGAMGQWPPMGGAAIGQWPPMGMGATGQWPTMGGGAMGQWPPMGGMGQWPPSQQAAAGAGKTASNSPPTSGSQQQASGNAQVHAANSPQPTSPQPASPQPASSQPTPDTNRGASPAASQSAASVPPTPPPTTSQSTSVPPTPPPTTNQSSSVPPTPPPTANQSGEPAESGTSGLRQRRRPEPSAGDAGQAGQRGAEGPGRPQSQAQPAAGRQTERGSGGGVVTGVLVVLLSLAIAVLLLRRLFMSYDSKFYQGQ